MNLTRMELLNELVNEVTKDAGDVEKMKRLSADLDISYSDDPMQFLNNVLKGIHSKGSSNDKNENQI